MTDATPSYPADFAQRSARFRDWCAFAVLIIGVGLALRHGLQPVIDIAREGGAAPLDVANRLLRELAAAAPAIFYVCALWALRDTFARLAGGMGLEPALSRGVGEVGTNLVWGAIQAVLITPNILAWTDERPGGFELRLETASIVIGFVGGALTLLARLFARAAEQKAELDEII